MGVSQPLATRLQLLGRIDLDGLPAPAAAALLAQPKRIAILAYIVLGTPRGERGRDELIATFWPDADRGLARGALRNSLHFLRTHLGAEAIRSRADRLVVDADVLWSDAVAFEEALIAGRTRDALALYEGDLLPAFRLPGCAAFERWLETERAEFRRKAATAAWSLSATEERRRHPAAAVDFARRAAALSAEQEVAVRSLMRLFDRVGDRAAAGREYETFRDRLQREHGCPPSPLTEALHAEIRTRPKSSTIRTDQGVSAVPVAEVIDRLAVLPFVATGGGPEEERVASGLTHGIAAALSRVSAMRVIGRSSLARYRRSRDLPSRRIAAELDVDGIVDGSVRILDGRSLVVVRLLDVRRGRPVWADAYERETEGLLTLEGELALAILEAAGIPLDEGERERAARRPTHSPDAFNWYQRGREAWNRRARADLETAATCFEEATRIDPGFALAYAGLADAYLVSYPAASLRPNEARVRAREAAQRALAIDSGLGEAHATLGLVSGVLDGDWAAAERSFRRAIELSPGHPTAHHWFGAYLCYLQRRYDEGMRELDLARELDPLSAIIHDDAALALMNQGRTSAAMEMFHGALQLDPDLWRGNYDLGVALIHEGAPERGVGHLDRAWRSGAYGADPDFSRPPAAGWRDRLACELDRLAENPPYVSTTAFEAALLSMLLGRRDEALRSLEAVPTRGGWGLVMQYYFAFSDLEGVSRFRELLDRAGLPFVDAARPAPA